MRLLILCEFPTLLGGERSMLATLPALTAAGFEVHVAAPPTGPLAAALRHVGTPVVTWVARDPSDRRKPLDGLRDELAAVLRQLRPGLLDANSLSMSRVSGPVAAAVGVRSVGHLRDIVNLSQQVVGDLNAHQRLIAVSRATREFHVAQGVDATRCVVIHNGVDLDEFRPRPTTGYLHRELRLPPKARLVAVIGQLGLRKGVDTALVAAGRVADVRPDVHWLIVGERTSGKHESRVFEAHLQTFASGPNLAGRVHFLGQRRDVAQLMVECELLVHAARQEPLGRVLLEAAASGLAIVATDVGGTREIFPEASYCAAVVSPEHSAAIGDAVIGLLGDDALRLQVGAAARRRAEQAFDIRVAAQRLVEEYQAVLNET